MKTIGIAAGTLALVCAAGTASAQTTRTPTNEPRTATPPDTTATPPGTTTTPGTTTPGTPSAPLTGTTTTQPGSVGATAPPLVTQGMAAEARDVLGAPVRAPSKAFEIGVDAGYTQGFGNVGPGRGVGDVAGAGGTVGVHLGYRVDPHWYVGGTGQYQGYGTSNARPNVGSVRGVTAGVEGSYHLQPYSRVDPFVTLGTGYRALVESPPGNAPTAVTHGIELGRIEVGLDVRPSESVAIAPVIGADLNMFMWRTGGGAEAAPLTGRGINTFVFAGLRGRFDVGGGREARPEQQMGRR